MKSFLIKTISVLFLFCLLQSTMAGFGPCPDAPFQHEDFNTTKFRGLWYLYSASNGYYDSYKNECRTDLIMSKGNQSIGLDFTVYAATQDVNSNRTERWKKSFECNGETDPHCTIVNSG